MSKKLGNNSLGQAPCHVDMTAAPAAANAPGAEVKYENTQDSRRPPMSCVSHTDAIVTLCRHKGNGQETTVGQIPPKNSNEASAEIHQQLFVGKSVTRSQGTETRPGVRKCTKHSPKRAKRSISSSSVQFLAAGILVAPPTRQPMPLPASNEHVRTRRIDDGILSPVIVGGEDDTNEERTDAVGSAQTDLSRSIEQGPGEGLSVEVTGCSLDMDCPDRLLEAAAPPLSEHQDRITIDPTYIAHEAIFSSNNKSATGHVTDRTKRSSSCAFSGSRCIITSNGAAEKTTPLTDLARSNQQANIEEAVKSQTASPAPAENTIALTWEPAVVDMGAATAPAAYGVARATGARVWQVAAEEEGEANPPSRNRLGLNFKGDPALWGNVEYTECVAKLEVSARAQLCIAHSQAYRKINTRSATEQGYYIARERLRKFHNARLVLEGMLEETSFPLKVVQETFETKEKLKREGHRKDASMSSAQANARRAATEVRQAECALREEEDRMRVMMVGSDVSGEVVVGGRPLLRSRMDSAEERVKKARMVAERAASVVAAEAVGRFDLASHAQHAEVQHQEAVVRYNELKARTERYKKKENTARDIALGAKQRWRRAAKEHVAAKAHLQCVHRVWIEAAYRLYHAAEIKKVMGLATLDTFLVALAGGGGELQVSSAETTRAMAAKLLLQHRACTGGGGGRDGGRGVSHRR